MNVKKELLGDSAKKLLIERGVTLADIADLVYFLQKDYVEVLKMEDCLEHVEAVLEKREVQNAIVTGIQLDILAERGQLLQPLQEIVESDEGL